MSLLLDAAYLLLALLASPYILFRMAQSRRWRAGLAQRLGFVRLRPGDKPCVWIHAVSVGEVNASRPLIAVILEEHPEWDVRISTTTDTGQKLAVRAIWRGTMPLFSARSFPGGAADFRTACGRTVIVLMELEVWPNFARAARARGVPVVIMNGRMREKSVAPLSQGPVSSSGALLDPAGPNLFCVQNETYRDRFVRAGFPAEKLRVTGNMKYDAVRTEADPAKLAPIRAALGLTPAERVWIASCTWPGEEEICLRVHRLLQKEVPELRLIIAPRHVERADEVARLIEKAGYGVRRRSAGAGPSRPGGGRACLTASANWDMYMRSRNSFSSGRA